MYRIALFSDDPKLRPVLAPALEPEYKLVSEQNSDRLKQLVRAGQVDVLLVDLDSELTDAKQAKLLEEIVAGNVPSVILADDDARAEASNLVQMGAYCSCRKPPALRDLKATLRRACEHATMKRELEGRRGAALAQSPAKEVLRCDDLIGSSQEMRGVYDLIYRVANLNASVLITGESGTGKELIARAVHNVGDRAKSPFVAVYCGAIPETLIESELFGHEKGAFTGTNGTRVGYFEQAANGTLFIDEIGELSLQTQTKLLRVLQQREFSRLGSGRTIPLKARVIFATHRNLPRMIAEGTFRLDLYHRLNVVSIESPALADRSDDIPALADLFISRYSDMYMKRVTGISPAAVALLQEYDWPGNVRELENVIQSAIVCSDNEIIQASDLPKRFQEMEMVDVGCDIAQVGSFERMLRDFKVRVATKAIEDCRGNKTLAARSLNISRSYLHRLIRLPEEPDEADVA